MTQTIEQLIAELRDEEIHTFDGFTVADVLEQLTARVRELEEENARLKAESEYKYVEQVLSPIRLLLKVAGCAETLADGVMDDGNGLHIMFAPDFDELSEALDALDGLPDDKPGYTLSGAGKAAWALRDLVGDTNG